MCCMVCVLVCNRCVVFSGCGVSISGIVFLVNCVRCVSMVGVFVKRLSVLVLNMVGVCVESMWFSRWLSVVFDFLLVFMLGLIVSVCMLFRLSVF